MGNAPIHIRYIKSAKVLERWNGEFHQRKTFSVKNRGKRDLPAFIQAHPIIVTVMKEYGRENLSDLSDRVCLGECEESLPASTPETQKRQGQFRSDCEKCFSRQ
jgi:hypothetical protein